MIPLSSSLSPLPTQRTHTHAPLPPAPSSASHPSRSPRSKPHRRVSLLRPATPKMALRFLAGVFSSPWLQFGFSRVALQLSIEFGLPLAASRESAWKNTWGLGVITCFKVSGTVTALGEAPALAVDGFIYTYVPFKRGREKASITVH